jgi:hypothetical protein
MLYFPIVLASVWSAVVVELVQELVQESVGTEGGALVAFGRVLATPPADVTVFVLCGLSASAALAMATTVSWARGRRLERRMAAELDARYALLAEQGVRDPATRLLPWRLAELQTLVDRLLEERRAGVATRGRHERHLVVVPDVKSVVDLELDLPVGPPS